MHKTQNVVMKLVMVIKEECKRFSFAINDKFEDKIQSV